MRMSSESKMVESRGVCLKASEGMPRCEDKTCITVHLSDISNENFPQDSKKPLIPIKGKIPAVRTYCFKKKKPFPGAYPLHFSPYKLANSSNPRAVSLSSSEIQKDLFMISQKTAIEFSSQYFDEVSVKSEHSSGTKIIVPRLPKVPNFQQRIARRKTSNMLQAPQSPAEERRQMKAAMKASRLELEQSAAMCSQTACESKQFKEGDMLFRSSCIPAR